MMDYDRMDRELLRRRRGSQGSPKRSIYLPSVRPRLRDRLLELALPLLGLGFGAGLSSTHESNIEGSPASFSESSELLPRLPRRSILSLLSLVGESQGGSRRLAAAGSGLWPGPNGRYTPTELGLTNVKISTGHVLPHARKYCD